ncbi:MAG: SnoaL-like protein [Actinobacteria bacterium]|nr:SnoaL-like protein [Actinomycetota bacterium]
MGEDRQDAQAIARRLTRALEARDLESLGEILALDVRWGGEEDTPQTCHSRDDVLA